IQIGADGGTFEIRKAIDVIPNAPFVVTLADTLPGNVTKGTVLKDSAGNSYTVAADTNVDKAPKAIRLDKTVPGTAAGLSKKPELSINGQNIKVISVAPVNVNVKLDQPLANSYAASTIAGSPT